MGIFKHPDRVVAGFGIAVCLIAILFAIDFTARLFLESEDVVLEQHGQVQYLESVGRLLQPAYAGYIKSGSTTIPSPNPKRLDRVYDHHLYYYISPAQMRPETAPIILWTGGGERGEESALLGGFTGILPYTFQSNQLLSTLTTFQEKVDAKVRAQHEGKPNYEALVKELDAEQVTLESVGKDSDADVQKIESDKELVEITDLGVNPRAWNKHATVVLVDAIPGVGYSYTAPAPGSWPETYPRRFADSKSARVPLKAYFNSSEVVANNLDAFLDALAERYPDLIKGRDLILAGGGYMAGRVLPLLADRLTTKESQKSMFGKVKSILMISPIIDPSSQYAAIPSTLSSMGLIDQEDELKLKGMIKKCKDASRKDRKNKGSLARAQACAIPAFAQRVLGPLKLQDVRETCSVEELSTFVQEMKDASKGLKLIDRANRKAKRALRKSKRSQRSAALLNLVQTQLLTSSSVNSLLDVKKIKQMYAQLVSKHNVTGSAEQSHEIEEYTDDDISHEETPSNVEALDDSSDSSVLKTKAKAITLSAASGVGSLTKDLYNNIKMESSPPPFLQNPPSPAGTHAAQDGATSSPPLQQAMNGGAPPAIAAIPQSGFRTPPKVLSDLSDSFMSKLPILLEYEDDRRDTYSFAVSHAAEERMNLVNRLINSFQASDARIVHIAKGFLAHPRVKRQLYANGQPGVNHSWNSRIYEAHLAMTIDSSRSSTDSLVRLMKAQAQLGNTSEDESDEVMSGAPTKSKPFRLIIVGGQFDAQMCPNCLDRIFMKDWKDRETSTLGNAITSVSGISCMNLAHSLVEAQKLIDEGLLKVPQHLYPKIKTNSNVNKKLVDEDQSRKVNVAREGNSAKRTRKQKVNAAPVQGEKKSRAVVLDKHTSQDGDADKDNEVDKDLSYYSKSLSEVCESLYDGADRNRALTAVNLLLSVKTSTSEVTQHVHTALKAIDSASETPIVEMLYELRNKCFAKQRSGSSEDGQISSFTLVGDLEPKIKPVSSLAGYEAPITRQLYTTSRNRGNSIAGYFRTGNRTEPLAQMIETVVLARSAGGSLGVLQSNPTALFDIVVTAIKDKRLRSGGNLKKLLESSDPTVATAARERAARRQARREARRLGSSGGL